MNIENILSRGNFQIKQWIVSGKGQVDVNVRQLGIEGEGREVGVDNQEFPQGEVIEEAEDMIELRVCAGNPLENHRRETDGRSKILQVLEEKVLGMYWEPVADEFKFKFSIILSGKKVDDVAGCDNIENHELSRKKILSQTARIFDPYGLLAPFTFSGKILMRKTCEKDGAAYLWDATLEAEIFQEWINFFKRLLQAQELRFKRCIKPKLALGNPILILFSDGSDLGYGCCAYTRWELSGGGFSTSLIAAKNRIAPKKKISTPRLELCGAVMAVRLRRKITQGMHLNFERVIHVTDSTIVRWQIQKESHGFKSFTATRIGEIQSFSDPNEWWWVVGDLNPADLTTRVTEPKDLGPESMWQNGPGFLKQPIEDWPLSKAAPEEKDIPDRKAVILATSVKEIEQNTQQVIKIERFSSYQKLLSVTAIVLLMMRFRTFAIGPDVNAESLSLAEVFLIKDAQKLILSDWQTRYRRLGPSMTEEGIVVVGKRMSQWLKLNWNQNYFILLPERCPFTRLYVRSVHEEDHSRDVDVTVAKVRRRFWVPKLKCIVKTIRDSCQRCRLKDKQLVTQEMGDLPLDRLMPAPPFYNTSMDLCGPYWIKDTVKQRAKRKVFWCCIHKFHRTQCVY